VKKEKELETWKEKKRESGEYRRNRTMKEIERERE
jgi:hypothetical protein